jgi:LAO/AO transport system kinase
MIRLGGEREWVAPVVATTATDARGIEDVWGAIERHRAFLEQGDRLAEGRRRRLVVEVASLVTERLRDRVTEVLRTDAALAGDLEARRMDPYRAASLVVERVAGDGLGYRPAGVRNEGPT